MKPEREYQATTYVQAPPHTFVKAQPSRILIPANCNTLLPITINPSSDKPTIYVPFKPVPSANYQITRFNHKIRKLLQMM